MAIAIFFQKSPYLDVRVELGRVKVYFHCKWDHNLLDENRAVLKKTYILVIEIIN